MISITRYAACAALALVVCNAHAQSSISFYGQVDLWAGSTRIAGQDRAVSALSPAGMQTSYWGFKSIEFLNSDLNAIAAIEGFYRPDTGALGRSDTDTVFSRSSWVGLDSKSMGSIRMGRVTNPFYIALLSTNPFVDSFTFSPSLIQTYGVGRPGGQQILGDTGWSNAIVYTSPRLAGWNATAIYSAGEVAAQNGSNKFAAVANYTHDQLRAVIAYQQVRFSLLPGDQGISFRQQQATLVAASYDLSWVKAYGQYLRAKDERTDSDVSKSIWQTGIAIPVGNGSMLASYAHTSAENFVTTSRATWTLGYDHRLSPRTDLYFAYMRDAMQGYSNGYTAGLGMRHTF